MAVMVATVFAASLLGSLHCAGMCGGFVSFYAGADTSRGIRRSFSHLAYNGGRLVTYTVLGVLFGWLGKAVDRAGSMAGVGRLAYLAAAVLMIAWGVWSLLLALNLRIPSLPAPAFLARAGRRVFHGMEKKPPVARAALLGLFSTFLPCGWLYMYAVMAAGTGSPWRGALVMAVFWAGTVPILVGIGTGVQLLAGVFRKRIPVLTASALILVGLMVLTGRFDRVMTGAEAGKAHCAAVSEESPSPPVSEPADHDLP